jgi:hypothetical protein
MPGDDTGLTSAQRALVLRLQQQALAYFLDNQTPSGLVLDRQHNHEPARPAGWVSTAATGMGLIALALASTEPYRLLAPDEAVRRVRRCLETALGQLPEDHGILPHFVDSQTGRVQGHDVLSTIDSSWLVAGALWAAAFLKDAGLEELSRQLYERIDWYYWTAPQAPAAKPLLCHGKTADGKFLPHSWNRLDGEAVFMYVLGAGAAAGRALPPECWAALRPFYGTVAGFRFNNADLGLFAFEYGIDLIDWQSWRAPGPVDLFAEAKLATRANRAFCRQAASVFATYQRFWGLSDGDGPGDTPARDSYRVYGPGERIDGTAHLTATLAAVAHTPEAVLENLEQAEHDPALGGNGRYGFSNINIDRNWVGRDVVGIDMGAAVLGVDNFLMADRVRKVFETVPYVRQGMERLGFSRR